MNYYKICGISFIKMSGKKALDLLKNALLNKKQTIVFTPNLQIIGECVQNQQLVKLLNSADLLLPDGIGIGMLCRKKGIRGVERITGIDTAYALLKFASEQGLKVFLLGGKAGVAQFAAARLKKQLPSLNICGTHHGYFDKKSTSPQNKQILRKIQLSRPDILFVCFGFPEQEKWIYENYRSLGSVRLFMGLGGSLDVWSGKVRRAPYIFRYAHLEWLWRCACQPKRILPLARNLFVLLTSRKF